YSGRGSIMTPFDTMKFENGVTAEIFHDADVDQPFSDDDALRIVVLHRRYIDPSNGACGRAPIRSRRGSARTRTNGSRYRCSSMTIPARCIAPRKATRSIARGIQAASASSPSSAPNGEMAMSPRAGLRIAPHESPKSTAIGQTANATATCCAITQAAKSTPAGASSASKWSASKPRRLPLLIAQAMWRRAGACAAPAAAIPMKSTSPRPSGCGCARTARTPPLPPMAITNGLMITPLTVMPAVFAARSATLTPVARAVRRELRGHGAQRYAPQQAQDGDPFQDIAAQKVRPPAGLSPVQF